MLRTICSTFPFVVCLCWFITFALRWHHNDRAKRVLTIFLGTCSVLYLCHAFYFNMRSLPAYGEGLWALCSLSVYPLYYIYITYLTCRPMTNARTMCCLLPGLLVALAIALYPESGADSARKLLNAAQIVCVMYFGYRRLHAFDREIANIYADTEGRDTLAVKHLLTAFVATSLLSVVANIVGKQFVSANEWMVTILVLFGILIHMLSHIGYRRDFSVEQYEEDSAEGGAGVDAKLCDDAIDEAELSRKIEALMTQGYYLNQNLTIQDFVRETKFCRTYVSSYINRTYGCSFSAYVNRQRVEYAKQLLRQKGEKKMMVVAAEAGFTNTQSFYRNFRKFTGMNPAKWLEEEKDAHRDSVQSS